MSLCAEATGDGDEIIVLPVAYSQGFAQIRVATHQAAATAVAEVRECESHPVLCNHDDLPSGRSPDRSSSDT